MCGNKGGQWNVIDQGDGSIEAPSNGSQARFPPSLPHPLTGVVREERAEVIGRPVDVPQLAAAAPLERRTEAPVRVPRPRRRGLLLLLHAVGGRRPSCGGEEEGAEPEGAAARGGRGGGRWRRRRSCCRRCRVLVLLGVCVGKSGGLGGLASYKPWLCMSRRGIACLLLGPGSLPVCVVCCDGERGGMMR